MKSLRNRLIVARELIQKGWGKGSYYYLGRYCLAGAVFRARRPEFHFGDSAEDEIGITDKELSAFGFQVASDLAAWNDAPERTQAQVLALLTHAINKLEKKR